MTENVNSMAEIQKELERLKAENSNLKISNETLTKSNDELLLLNSAAFEGIMVHEKGILITANDHYYEMFGYEPNELIGKQVIPLTLIPETMDIQKRKIESDGSSTYEIQGLRKDGTTFLLEVRGKRIDYGGRKIRGVALIDITERKKIEDALRDSEKMLRFLSTRLFEAQEQERSRVSKELHDQLGHDLVILKSMIRSIHKKLNISQEDLKKECENIVTAVEEIIDNVRRISRDLMPSMLEDLGLMSSIQWLVENFSKKHEIKITLDMEDIDGLFSREVRINLFRIFQETLTNISKHASATVVQVKIYKTENDIIFEVRDDGKGFELSKVLDRKFENRGVGLTAMKERMNILGGNFDAKSNPGEGTLIAFTIPKGDKEDKNGKYKSVSNRIGR